MFGTLSGGEKPKPGRSENWLHCVTEALQAFQATNGSTEGSPSGIEVKQALWPTAAKRWDKWHDGVVEGAERLMVEWHQQEEAKRCARHEKEVAQATRDRKGGAGGGSTTPAHNLAKVGTRCRIGLQRTRPTRNSGKL